MKLLSAITIAAMALGSLLASKSSFSIVQNSQDEQTVTKTVDNEKSDFEKAVALIKKYEGLHQPKHYPLVGYGHQVLPGEKFNRNKTMSEAEADKLLRKDLLKNCAVFREWGKDSLILGVLAYNIGSGNALRSTVAKKLKAGDRDIYANYISHSKYRGKVHSQIQRRRIEEFETLFIKDGNNLNKEETEKEVLIESESSRTLALSHSNDDNQSFVSALFCKSFDIVNDLLGYPEKFITSIVIPSLHYSNDGINHNQMNNSWMACI